MVTCWTSSSIALFVWVCSINSSKTISNSPEVSNFNRLFLKLNRFICNYKPLVLPGRWSSTFLTWSELGWSRPFWPTRDLRMQFSLVCEPALGLMMFHSNRLPIIAIPPNYYEKHSHFNYHNNKALSYYSSWHIMCTTIMWRTREFDLYILTWVELGIILHIGMVTFIVGVQARSWEG
jgi:hypothetical protein